MCPVRSVTYVSGRSSPVNTRRFSLSPFLGLSLKKPFCQKFAKSRFDLVGECPGPSDAAVQIIAAAVRHAVASALRERKGCGSPGSPALLPAFLPDTVIPVIALALS